MAWNDWAVLLFAFVSAVVALITAFRWWRDRPMYHVPVRVRGKNLFPLVGAAHRGEAGYSAEVMNFSTEPVRDVFIEAFGGTLGTGGWRQDLKSLEPRQSVAFTLDTEEPETGWFLIGFTPTTRNARKTYLTWHPFLEAGPLAEERNRQLVEARIRRALVRRVLRLPPAPGIYAVSTMSTSPELLARLQLQGLGAPWRLRRLSWLVRLLPKTRAEAAGAPGRPGRP